MLSEIQIDEVWKRQLAAEVRSFYFAELASKYAQKKQWITFATLFFPSSAAGSLLAKSPVWIPTTLSVLVALLTAYTIAINLDLTIRSMAKLHTSWSELTQSYQQLWDNVHSENASLTSSPLPSANVSSANWRRWMHPIIKNDWPIGKTTYINNIIW